LSHQELRQSLTCSLLIRFEARKVLIVSTRSRLHCATCISVSWETDLQTSCIRSLGTTRNVIGEMKFGWWTDWNYPVSTSVRIM